MAAGTDAELRIVLRAVGDELLAGMRQMEQAVAGATGHARDSFKRLESEASGSMAAVRDKVSEGVEGAKQKLETLSRVAELAFAALAGERVFASIIESTQQYAFEVEHLNHTLGVTPERASVYVAAGREAGVSTEQIDQAIRGLTKTIAKSSENFANAGVSIYDFNGKLLPTEEILRRTLDRLNEYAEGEVQLTTATQLFSRAQPGMVAELTRWMEHLHRAEGVVRDLGLGLTGEGIESSREYEAAVADMGLTWLSVKEVLAGAIRPELEAVIEKVLELARDGSLRDWASDGATGLGELLHVGGAVAAWLLEHVNLVRSAALAWVGYKAALIGAETVGALATAFESLNAAMAVGAGLNALGFGIQATVLTEEALAAQSLGAMLNNLGISMGIARGEAGLMAGAFSTMAVEEAGVAAGAPAILAFLGGPVGLTALLAAGAVGVITYTGKWHSVGELLSSIAGEVKRELAPELDGLHALLKRIAEDDTVTIWLEGIRGALHGITADLGAGKTEWGAWWDAFVAAAQAASPEIALLMQLHAGMQAAFPQPGGAGRSWNYEGEQYAAGATDVPLPKPGEPKIGTPPEDPSKRKAASDAAFQALMREKAVELEAAKENAEKRLTIEQDYTRRVALQFGATSDAYTKQLEAQRKAQAAADDELERMLSQSIESRLRMELEATQGRRELVEREAKEGKITKAEELRQLEQLLRDEYDARKRAVEAELELQAGGAEKLAAVRAAEAAASTPEQKHAALVDVDNPGTFSKLEEQLQELETKFAAADLTLHLKVDPTADALAKEAKEVRDVFDGVFGEIENGIAIVNAGILSGTQSATDVLVTLEEKAASEAMKVVSTFVLDVIKMQGLRLAAYLLDNKAMLASDKLTTGESLALKFGSWLLELLGFTKKEVTKTGVKATNEAAQTTIAVTSDQTRVASHAVAGAEERAIEATTAKASLMDRAASAAGKAYDALAGIYIVGPVLGAIAAAAVFAGVMAFGSFISAAGGADLGNSSPIAQLHPKEMVLPAHLAEGVRDMTARGTEDKPDAAAAPPLEAGKDDKDGKAAGTGKAEGTLKHEGTVEHKMAPLGGSSAAAMLGAGHALGGGGGGGRGGGGPVEVHVKSSSATLTTRAHGITQTSIHGPVEASGPSGGALPTEDQATGPKSVTVTNAPLRVAFSAITTMITVFAAPLGIGMGIGVGFMAAFGKGGDVPEDMLAKLHANEMVLPPDLAQGLRNLIRLPADTAIGAIFRGRGDGDASGARGDVGGLLNGGAPRVTDGASSLMHAALGRDVQIGGPDIRIMRPALERIAAGAERGAAAATNPTPEVHHHYDNRVVEVHTMDARSFREKLEHEGGDVIFKVVDRHVSHNENRRAP